MKRTMSFFQQEKDGIIERLMIVPEENGNFIWILHRPVIKNTELVTTKIRPVFNCSLKAHSNYSFNEAVYPGIILTNNLIEILLKSRTNKFVMLREIKKAILMIRLKTEREQNRFCFFIKKNNKLICYHYKTLLFGFNACPFILNFILQYHINRYPDDVCMRMIKNIFYEDNLIVSDDDNNKLMYIYKMAVTRLLEGNFLLRSCNSNSKVLKALMEKDNSLTQHNSKFEKFLGYNYDLNEDLLNIITSSIDKGAKTKRGLLAQSTKVFDLLSLYDPVNVKLKLILRSLLKHNLDWDTEVPQHMQSK